MRVGVCGFQHETNTFAPVKADYAAFAVDKNFPGLVEGEEMLRRLAGAKVPTAGAIGVLQSAGVEIVPLTWCIATPSAHVTEGAYERIAGRILDQLGRAGPLDGLFLELHGAMVAEHADDGEGELLRRIRRLAGRDLPIAVSLDLHANVTADMVAHADLMDLYRYYPHIDMVATGARTAASLLGLLATASRPAKAFRQLDFLIPINGGCTDFGPAREVYLEIMPRIERDLPTLRSLSFASGFPHADIGDVGPSVLAYADSQGVADAAAERLAGEVARREPAFLPEFYPAAEAVARALAIAAGASRPVIIADTQDNPGGGGPGDTTGLLRALIAAEARGSTIGALIDPDAAAAAHAAGEGAVTQLAIGGKRMPGDTPLLAACRVLAARADGWTALGPMRGGMPVNLGKVALVETVAEGVRIVLASRPSQTADSSIFRHLGLVPEALPIIAVKSSVHFRADFTPMAEVILVAVAPGPVAIDHTELPYRKLRPGLRIMPRRG